MTKGSDLPSEQSTRRVMFIIARDNVAVDELNEAVGIPPDSSRFRSESPVQATWEIISEGSGDDDLSAMIMSILARIHPIKHRLQAVCASDNTKCILRIVQYIGDDKVGPGFALGANEVSLLSELHAALDVDQYWRPS